MKRSILTLSAAVSLVPMYLVIWNYSGSCSIRNVYRVYTNELRRDVDYIGFPRDPQPPHLGFSGWRTTFCIEASIRMRHIVVNLPWAYAFLLAGTLPTIWLPRALLRLYRRCKAGWISQRLSRFTEFDAAVLLLLGIFGLMIFFVFLDPD